MQQTSLAQEIGPQGFIVRMQMLQWIRETSDVGFGFGFKTAACLFFSLHP